MKETKDGRPCVYPTCTRTATMRMPANVEESRHVSLCDFHTGVVLALAIMRLSEEQAQKEEQES